MDEQELYDAVLAHVLIKRSSSVAGIQRQFGIAYNPAVALLERMEKDGHVSKVKDDGTRDILRSPEHVAKAMQVTEAVMDVAAQIGADPQKVLEHAADKAGVTAFRKEEDNTQDTGGVSGQRLKAFIERIERLEEEKSGLAEDIKDVYAESKAVGFDTKIIRKVIRLRKMDKEKRHEEEELVELYKSAIGLD